MPEQTTRLVFELFGRDKASPQFDKFGRKVQETHTHVTGLAKGVGVLAGAFAGLEVIDKATEFLKKSVEEGRESELLMKRTANVIATTGHVAHVSVKDVDELAASIQRKSAVDHEQVISSENMLLTFKNIRNELGHGNDIFDRAAVAVSDLAATPFANMTSASKMLGKALNDPTKGLTALNRAGVTFSQKQKDQILGYVKQNDILSAQKVILHEVESQFHGAAASQATAGKRAALAWKDTEEELGKKLIPIIDDVENKFADLVESGDLQKWGKEISTDLQPVVTILEDAGKVTLTTLKIFDGMPKGAKEAILLAGGVRLLAGSLPSLGANGLVAEAGLLRTRAGLAGLAVQANAGRIAAGGAGLALLTYADQVSTAGSAVNDTMKVVGAAATGFAVGGPWGAAIGGGIEILGLFGKKNHAVAADVDGLTDSLNTQTGALTKNSRKQLQASLEKAGAFTKAGKLGVNLGDVQDAAQGNAAAIARIRAVRDQAAKQAAALAEAQSPGSGRAISAGVKRQYDVLLNEIGAQSDAVTKAKKKWDELNKSQKESKSLNALTAGEIRKVVKETKGIPKSVATKFTQPGYADAVANVVDIAHRYHLTPKQVTTTLRALDYSTSQIKAVLRLMKQADSTVARPRITVSTNAATIARQVRNDLAGIKSSSISVNVQSRKAEGGAIHGPGTSTSDDIPIWASDGEHMFDADDVKAMGGQAAVYRFRENLHKHGNPQALAHGGAVGRGTAGGAAFDLEALGRVFARVSAREHAKALTGVRFVADGRGGFRATINGG